MRALRPAALPSDTSVRFALLLAAVTTASLYLFQALWFAGRSQGFLTVVKGCGLTSGGLTPSTLGGFGAELAAGEACRAGLSREQGVAALAGATLVLVAAWALYRVLPAWRERRRQLAEPDPMDAGALIASVDQLAGQAGVHPTPTVRLDVSDPAISGIAYGAGSHLRLGLSGGLVVAQITEPATYDAVVRHELGHVANRDVRWTYYSVATWWSFLVLALTPVVLTFLVRDPQYVLRLGWRTAVLAGLVATTLAAVLRTRELYADARAADWGSASALDRVLAQRSQVVQRAVAAPVEGGAHPLRRRVQRPAVLRLHPDPEARRDLLADPDGLFTASGWVAFAAALACGTAAASMGDIAYLLVPKASVAIATLAVAPLLAIALCVPAWRVALRGVVRGTEPSIVLPMGIGAGAGLALAPLLTMAAAMGSTATSAEGWLGYLIWSVGTVVLGLAVAWWICGTARLSVTAALGSASGPARALTMHVVVASLVVALWLAAGAQARTLFTTLGLADLQVVAPWDLLPSLAFGMQLPYLPLLVAAALLALPLWALARLRAERPVEDWPWRERRPTQPGDLPALSEAARTRPAVPMVLLVGIGAGGIAGFATLGVFLAGEALREDVRTSDAFALALGSTIEWAILVAGVVAGAVAVVVLPRLWWPVGLTSSLVAMATAAAGGWVLLTSNRYGFLQHSSAASGPLGLNATLLLLVRPAARAVLPCVLVVAAAGAVRSWRKPAGPVPEVAAGPELSVTRAPGESAVRKREWVFRALVGAVVAAVTCGLLIAPRVAGVLTLQPAALQNSSATVVVPATWTGGVDPTSDQIVLDNLDGEVRVVLVPVDAPSAASGAGSVVVGGVELPQVGQLDQGTERLFVFEGQTPAGGQRVVVIGRPQSVIDHEAEILALLAVVQWRDARNR